MNTLQNINPSVCIHICWEKDKIELSAVRHQIVELSLWWTHQMVKNKTSTRVGQMTTGPGHSYVDP